LGGNSAERAEHDVLTPTPNTMPQTVTADARLRKIRFLGKAPFPSPNPAGVSSRRNCKQIQDMGSNIVTGVQSWVYDRESAFEHSENMGENMSGLFIVALWRPQAATSSRIA
jgi:hypothetical protein